MNPPELVHLARSADLGNDVHFALRIRFGMACVARIEHLLTEQSVLDIVAVGHAYVAGECDEEALAEAASTASRLAKSHPGSGSIDGSGSAAFTASHAVSAALNGQALPAADYAAYASVYAYASYAVTDPAAYETEHQWQINKLQSLLNELPETPASG
jgi:hypothetical protein